jgi:hypothetical protein
MGSPIFSSDRSLIRASTLLVCSCPRRQAARGGARREELVLGDELDGLRAAWRVGLEPEEALAERRGGDGDLAGAGFELGERGDARRLDAVVAQHVQQRLAPALGVGHEQHAVGRLLQVTAQARERLRGTAVDGDIGQRPRPGGVRGRRVGGRRARLRRAGGPQRQRGESARRLEELLGREEDVLRRQDRALRVVLQEAVALARVRPEALQGLVDGAMQDDGRRGGHVVEDRGRRVEEQRQVVLDAAAGDAVLHVLVQPHPGRVALQAFAPALAEGLAGGLVEREFAAREQAHLGHGVEAALRVRVEGADGVDLVVEQVDAVRHGRAHRKQIDQAAAHGVLARRDDRAHVGVAGQRELRAQRRLVEPRLLAEVEGRGREEGGRRQAGERRARGQQDDVDAVVAFSAGGRLRRVGRGLRASGRRRAGVAAAQALALAMQAPQRGQALGDEILVRGELVPGQRLPVGEYGDAQVRREEGQLVGQALRVGGLGADDERQLPGRGAGRGEVRDQQRIGRAGRARQREALAGNEGGQLHRDRRGKRRARPGHVEAAATCSRTGQGGGRLAALPGAAPGGRAARCRRF